MGVFSKSQGPANDVKRNSYDGSFDNHCTLNFGELVPVFCKEAIPGDTFEIDSAVGINAMPTIFPVQSKINASIHYFYVRGKNLWKDYYDWYFGTKDGLTPPYISPSQFEGKALTGSIFDYMGLPTTLIGSKGGSLAVSSFSNYYPSTSQQTFPLGVSSSGKVGTYFFPGTEAGPLTLNDIIFRDNSADYYSTSNSACAVGSSVSGFPTKMVSNGTSDNSFDCCDVGDSFVFAIPFSTDFSFEGYTGSRDVIIKIPYNSPYRVAFPSQNFGFLLEASSLFNKATSILLPCSVTVADNQNVITFSVPENYVGKLQGALYIHMVIQFPAQIDALKSIATSGYLSYDADHKPVSDFISISVPSSVVSTAEDIGTSTNVFSSGKIHINALPFRAYESIYNAFYRDSRNNPFLINGEPEYNKFITSDDGGIDRFNYRLHSRNWENDFLTTSQPTPQFGNAPLVGITSTGNLSFTASEDGETYNVQATVADDGDTITGVSYQSDLPASVRRSLVDVVSSGISINDFRNVNAFQRFLETSMRRGLKAFDQIKSHFNVDVSERLLDMPEFLGGISGVMNASKVNQTTETEGSPLGSYAGQLSFVSQQKHKIKCFCDQPGYIIGILCVHPVPLYSQLLPKMFTKFDSLDNYFPEFGHIGLQPIPLREVAPIQAFSEDATGANLSETFGYQRAWYDYLSNVDEVHGLFRTQLRNFVLNRVFDNVPKLGPDFTVINDKHLNDIFSVVIDNDSQVNHKLLAHVVFDVQMTRPIPKFGIPKLEPSV